MTAMSTSINTEEKSLTGGMFSIKEQQKINMFRRSKQEATKN